MTDDLDDLKSMMNMATPRADETRRAENLALARKNFDDLQGSREQPRPTPVTGRNALWTGVTTMLNALTSKAALGTTTALVACGFLFLTPQGQSLLTPPTATDPVLTKLTGASEANDTRASENAELQIAEDVAILDAISPPVPTVESDHSPAPEAFAVEGTAAEEPAAMAAEPALPMPAAPVTALRSVNRSEASQTAPSPADTSRENANLYATAPIETVEEAEIAQPQAQALSTLSVGDRIAPDQSPAATQPNTETYANATLNPLKITSEEPVSTFSIDVDTAAYSLLRSSLSRGQLPPANAVRIEELINYFPYDYPTPDAGDAPFRTTVSSFETPWNANTQLVHIALQGQMPAIEDRPPLNLVFLIDTSGSMGSPDKLPLLKQSFRLMLDQLRPEDEVAIVEYAGSAGQVLAPTAASDRTTILQAIQSLGAGGSTNGQGGLEQAYTVADAMAADDEVSRVILATDGDFNVGINNPDTLKDFIADKRDTGTYLSVLGFGRGNLDDATMQALAQNGNGTAAYIDTLSEAQKVLVDQLSGALFPIAGDVKVQVEFNPAQVAEYRLIGYETRALNREDFNNDIVDAGELGAGHSVTAIYEITPVGSLAQLSDPLRYAPNTVAATSDEIGFVKLRYKAPGEYISQLIETPIIGQSIPGTEAIFAAAIAGFGQLLRDDSHLGDWSYDEAIALANANRGDDNFGYRTEAVQLMRLVQSLSK
ncbi:Ca-activated chloride channel family protein [Yoonia maritima]|uniref:Ca-activated chloride channel family protein n=1 Tax=Yoonia maritima TaxID=1435347 RepID=A0A2T0VZU1_9RHOB|nr:VWA domain-containing protein [Yoonia maritima]PRY78095.1 Ca-activated chloride channel family protein [Yoonia maritima]